MPRAFKVILAGLIVQIVLILSFFVSVGFNKIAFSAILLNVLSAYTLTIAIVIWVVIIMGSRK